MYEGMRKKACNETAQSVCSQAREESAALEAKDRRCWRPGHLVIKLNPSIQWLEGV